MLDDILNLPTPSNFGVDGSGRYNVTYAVKVSAHSNPKPELKAPNAHLIVSGNYAGNNAADVVSVDLMVIHRTKGKLLQATYPVEVANLIVSKFTQN